MSGGGWIFTKGATLASTIARLLETNGTLQGRCLQHKTSGATLWQVREYEDGPRAIVGASLEHEPGRGYGFRLFCEQADPAALNCPLGFFELAPPTSEDWRQCVRDWHFHQGRIARLAPGDVVALPAPYEPRKLRLTRQLASGDWEGRGPAGRYFRLQRAHLDYCEIEKADFRRQGGVDL